MWLLLAHGTAPVMDMQTVNNVVPQRICLSVYNTARGCVWAGQGHEIPSTPLTLSRQEKNPPRRRVAGDPREQRY